MSNNGGFNGFGWVPPIQQEVEQAKEVVTEDLKKEEAVGFTEGLFSHGQSATLSNGWGQAVQNAGNFCAVPATTFGATSTSSTSTWGITHAPAAASFSSEPAKELESSFGQGHKEAEKNWEVSPTKADKLFRTNVFASGESSSGQGHKEAEKNWEVSPAKIDGPLAGNDFASGENHFKPVFETPSLYTAKPSPLTPRKASLEKSMSTPRKASLEKSSLTTPANTPMSKPIVAEQPALATPIREPLENNSGTSEIGPLSLSAFPETFSTPQRDEAMVQKEQKAAADSFMRSLEKPIVQFDPLTIKKDQFKVESLEKSDKVPELTNPSFDELKLGEQTEVVSAPRIRSESIDDSWVKIEKVEIINESEPVTDNKPVIKKVVMPAGRRASTRSRKAPQVVEVEAQTSVTKKNFEIPTGSGIRFADIPHIAAMINKKKSADKIMLNIHKAIYGRPGEASKRKANLRQFSGYRTDQDKELLMKRLSGHTIPALRELCIFLNLERSGEKAAILERIAGYLMEPKSLGESKIVSAPKKAARKSSASQKQQPKAKRTKTSIKSTEEVLDSDDDYADEIADLKALASADGGEAME